MATSWLILEEMLERGDPAFVDALREQADAEALGKFAARWFHDRRREARRLLLDYLDRPLNAYRHEALVKRLFKLAEKAGDDELMGRFVVAFDRSVRRRRRIRHEYDARARRNIEVEVVEAPRVTMPREQAKGWFRWFTPEIARNRLLSHRLFSVHTRNYLRRRSWRYFRKLGKQGSERYLPGVLALLKCYTDADTPDGLALLDNWGLVHILFHHCEVLEARPSGWMVCDGRSLSDLVPAPIFESLWKQAPTVLLELLKEARCRPVRQWVLRLLQRDHGNFLNRLPLAELLGLLTHADSEVIALAAEALRNAPGLDHLPLERWLGLLETNEPLALEVISDLMASHLHPDRLTLAQAVALASSRPLPVARLGLRFLKAKTPRSEEDCRALLGLVEAEAAPVRPELVQWARGVLSASAFFQSAWVLEYLDSRHADVRGEGWRWFQEEARARDDVGLWARLFESPYDDLRMKLVGELERRVAGHESPWSDNSPLDPELVRLLWATVLLNIHRGNRSKPVVVRQLVGRLAKRSDEAPLLLPILSVALRSVSGPEWRAGLAGVVQLVARRPELEMNVRQVFPELAFG